MVHFGGSIEQVAEVAEDIVFKEYVTYFHTEHAMQSPLKVCGLVVQVLD